MSKTNNYLKVNGHHVLSYVFFDQHDAESTDRAIAKAREVKALHDSGLPRERTRAQVSVWERLPHHPHLHVVGTKLDDERWLA